MIDVCLILESTYPFVAGGVSTWVHQLISAMKDLKFGIVYISPHSDPTRSVKYDIPPHVLYLKEVSLHDYDLTRRRDREPRPADFDLLKRFYLGMEKEDYTLFPHVLELFQGETCCFDNEVIFSSKEIWHMLLEFYERFAPDVSFLDFFWTWRGIHLPIMQVLMTEIPRAKIYHSISTGYAGLLGSIAKVVTGNKYFLTEHGIYTHERRLEISQANWIYERSKRDYRAESELSFFKRFWISIFKVMSHLTYRHADRIFTLYEGNRTREILEGAQDSKITVIPNGIDIRHFSAIKRISDGKPKVGLIGRVVSIKDVKTFIQAAKIVSGHLPNAKFFVVGPTDEEEDYFDECQLLVESLKMDEKLNFTGRRDVMEFYACLDVLVLTSLSEAQPYVILEANLCGIPVVATDVGACRELLEGKTHEDRMIGPSGLLTEVSHPEDTAAAILKILEDRELAKKMSHAGMERVKKFYDQDDLLSRYLNIYETNL